MKFLLKKKQRAGSEGHGLTGMGVAITSVTMSTLSLHISSSKHLQQYPVQQPQEPGRTDASGSKGVNRFADHPFAQLMHQAQGASSRSVQKEGSQTRTSSADAGADTAQAQKNAQDAAVPGPEMNQALLGVQASGNSTKDDGLALQRSRQLTGTGNEDTVTELPASTGNASVENTITPDQQASVTQRDQNASMNGDASAEFSKLLRGMGNDTGKGDVVAPQTTVKDSPDRAVNVDKQGAAQKKDIQEPRTAGNMPLNKTAGIDKQPDGDKNSLSLASRSEDSGGPAQNGLETATAQKKDIQEPRPVSAKNSPVSAPPDFATTMPREMSALQQQTAQAVVAGRAESGEAGQSVRSRPADLAELFDHTVSIIKDGNRLLVKLEPEGLGKLDINLSLHDGKVQAQISVHDDATKKMIDANMQHIMDALLKEGLSVGGLSVSMQKNDAWDQTAAGKQEYDGKRTGTSAQAVSATDRTADSSRLVNIFI